MITPVLQIRVGEQTEAIAQLHLALQILGFPPDADELRERRAGDSTFRAVRAFQRDNRLTPDETWLVDEATAAVINDRLAAHRLIAQQAAFLVKGAVTTVDGEPV